MVRLCITLDMQAHDNFSTHAYYSIFSQHNSIAFLYVATLLTYTQLPYT